MRLIDADKLLSEARSVCGRDDCRECDFATEEDSWCCGELFGVDIIRAKTIDAVKRGAWIRTGYACGETEWTCPICGCSDWRTGTRPFCAHCGARLEVDDEVN